MSKGITKACPKCKKIVFSSGEFQGIGWFQIKCPYCQTLVKVHINPKPSILLTLIATIIILISIAIHLENKLVDQKIKQAIEIYDQTRFIN